MAEKIKTMAELEAERPEDFRNPTETNPEARRKEAERWAKRRAELDAMPDEPETPEVEEEDEDDDEESED